MPFDDDVREVEDERELREVRLLPGSVALTDKQVSEWIASRRERGARIELTSDGLKAVY